MSAIKSRECTREVIAELAVYSGYSTKQIEEVINSVYAFIQHEIKKGSRDTIRLSRLGSLQISKQREMNLIHNHEGGILKVKNETGIYTNVNPKRCEEILNRYKDEFDKHR